MMRPEAILAAMEKAFGPLDPLTGHLLYEQEKRDRREHCGPSLAERLEELFAAIERLAHDSHDGRAGHRRARVRKLVVSKAEAARALGIDAKTTLARLIDDKHIRTVKAPHGERVPWSEVQRLAQQGIPPASTPPRRTRPKAPPRADEVGDAIRGIKIT